MNNNVELDIENFPLEVLTIYKFKNPKTRIGKDNDGGYVILDNCPYDILVACGIKDDISFENEFIKRYNVPCCAFDGTIKKLPKSNPYIKFINKNISNKNNASESNLYDLIDEYENIFLKMDIEGDEYKWLSALTRKQLNKFRQIVIEFHFPFYKNRYKCLEKLTQTHYLCHLHGNNFRDVRYIKGVKVPKVMECTFIRKEDIEYIPEFNDKSIPTELDMANKPIRDIYLNGYPYER